MTATINGIMVTGTPDEIYQLIQKANSTLTVLSGTTTIYATGSGLVKDVRANTETYAKASPK